MSDKFTQLQSVVTAEELQELTIRRAAVDRLRDMYEKTPLDKVGREWRAAKNELEVEIDKLWQKYNKEAPAFKDVSAAWEYLKKQGYEVGKSSVYKAVKDGLLKKEADGRVLEIAVRAYAASLRKKDSSADPAEVSSEKLREEIKNLRLKNERQQFEFDRDKGKYILRDDLVLEIIGRVQVFEAQFDHFSMTKAPEIVQLCSGDTATVPQVQAFLRAEKDRLITAMADTERFQVIMVADEVGGDQGSEVGNQEGRGTMKKFLCKFFGHAPDFIITGFKADGSAIMRCNRCGIPIFSRKIKAAPYLTQMYNKTFYEYVAMEHIAIGEPVFIDR